MREGKFHTTCGATPGIGRGQELRQHEAQRWPSNGSTRNSRSSLPDLSELERRLEKSPEDDRLIRPERQPSARLPALGER
jgi:hypothetical protein